MEDVAKGYYRELIWRSFLQPSPYEARQVRCTMHDLFRVLAMFLVGDESLLGDPQAAPSNTSMIKLRHLTISSNRESVSIPHLDCLRRLWLYTPPSLDTQVIGGLKHLRVLTLCGDKIENIPDSIGDLLHLRLLNLGGTKICKLPDSLGNLINLQFLLLSDCESLYILPRSITRLCNLRRLNLKYTPLNYVPRGIGKLEHLNHVSGFIVEDNGGDGEGCNLEELQMLKNLSHLDIDKLEKASKSTPVLLNKPRLKTVMLRCTPDSGGHNQQQEMDEIVQVFDELCPPPSLDDLVIENFFGGRYPRWMLSNSFSTAFLELTYLQLRDCANCPQLPQLGQLPQLKYLRIKGATAVVSIGPEFLGNGELAASAFPNLEYLVFLDMINWEEWSLTSGEGDNEHESSRLLLFPRLRKLFIDNCPKLKDLPSGLNRANIPHLFIRSAHSLSRVSYLPALKELEVYDCPMLKCVEKLESLQSLTLFDQQENNTILPQWLILFLLQRERPHYDRFILHLVCSAQALHDCLQGHRYWLLLQQVPRFTAYTVNQDMYLKYTKEPYYYETNITDEDQEHEILSLN
ncbi:putative disease resistance protein At3g14460 [Dioscorea cayenensis subsp. rotundata]|uniref:Disease resistance protein At3g14460 n=1 Tax=Dioscorea cayennensis subsp. rotundata TaxID=55577 RepID=A0AB40CCJ5_DIOCR|nr:putative disease resistance protein At3g14460 [Dioscorea cayenensis subsp. rotundata]XP_039136120.1 putative disease resistance protein At3g14460 [Dioscorea cayenensis subsp. rotundata]XP_039136121.1 putative disease resistance protein At3g14460 [Dioscorea cayenensis subsp. rotundata]XP_039136122.1 putative disease resistance protein At3g14460 [Dioscorea cayenensis subsp. rotundata]XP_039136123.1 putative disease resistance protein At3g14460 [Dioscorea cayenensis subsp. rotundata]XP_0391361